MPFRFKRTAETLLADRILTDRMYRWWRVHGNKSLAQIAFDNAGEAQTGQRSPHVAGVPLPQRHQALSFYRFRYRYPIGLAGGFEAELPRIVFRFLKELAIVAQKRGIELPFELIFSFATVVDPDVRTLCRTVFGSEIAIPMVLRK